MLKKICTNPDCGEVYNSLDKSVCDKCGGELYYYLVKDNFFHKIKSLFFKNKLEIDIISELNQLNKWDYVFDNYEDLDDVDKEKYFKKLNEIKNEESHFKYLNKLRTEENKYHSIYLNKILLFIGLLDDEIDKIKSNNLEDLKSNQFINYLNQDHSDKSEYIEKMNCKFDIARSLKNLEYINYYNKDIKLTKKDFNDFQKVLKDIESEIQQINEYSKNFDKLFNYFQDKIKKPSFYDNYKEKLLNLIYLDILDNFEGISKDALNKTREIISIYNKINLEQELLDNLIKKNIPNFFIDFNDLIDKDLDKQDKKLFLENNKEFIDNIYSFNYSHILKGNEEIKKCLEFLEDYDKHWDEILRKHDELEEILSLTDNYNLFNDDWDVFLYQYVSDIKLKLFLLKYDSLKNQIFCFTWPNTKRDDYKNAIKQAQDIKFKFENIDDYVEFSNAELKALKFIEDTFYSYVSVNDKENLIKNYQDFDISIDNYEMIANTLDLDLFNFDSFKKIYRDLDNFVLDNNPEFVKREINRFKWFFNNFEGYCLDKKQQIAIVTDEDNLEIVAGAGAGKTLTICANVEYLHKKGVPYENILCLSFSDAATKDLSKRLKSKVKTSTIHSLGSSILKSGGKPNRADDGNVFDFTSKDVFLETIYNDAELFQEVVKYFTIYPSDIRDENKESIEDIYKMKEGSDLLTLKQRYYGDNLFTYNRERVKSVYELLIANFLFVNGIDYKYETYYQADGVPDFGYAPDFYLPKEDIYIEHFGIDCNCEAKWLGKKSEDYVEEYKRKVALHKNNGTKLIKSYSCYAHKDILLSKLKMKLEKENVEFKEIDPVELIEKIAINSEFNSFYPLTSLIDAFLNRFKQNQYKKEQFDVFRKMALKEESDYIKNRHLLFFDIAEKFLTIYENKLKEWGKIDFNDMINNAIKEVQENGFNEFSYKYIIVDEFQDTSDARYQLIKEVQNSLGAKLIVVGDDWQSIYGFNGCNVELFTEFENQSENYISLPIETTYRNSQNLINVVGEFIKRNDKQISKNLISKKENLNNPIKVAYHDSRIENYVNSLENCILDCSKYSDNIRILGRFNSTIRRYLGIKNDEYIPSSPFSIISDEDNILKIEYSKNPSLNITFSTIHKSKGLEEDNVILLGLEDKTYGFPSKIQDDPILKYVDFNREDFKIEEERRLFYVALTRTKFFNYLLVHENYKSEFFEELEEIADYPFEVIVSPYNSGDVIKTDIKCPLCGSGNILLRKNKNDNYYFKCSHRVCKWRGGYYNGDLEDLDFIEPCNKCQGMMYVKKYFNNGVSNKFVACSKNNKVNKCYPSSNLNEEYDIINEEFYEEISKISKQNDVIFGDHGEIFLKTGLKCSQCDEGEVILKKSRNGNYLFLCSHCFWQGGQYTQKLEDLKYVKHCVLCNGIEYTTEEPYCSGTLLNEAGNIFFKCSKAHKY